MGPETPGCISLCVVHGRVAGHVVVELLVSRVTPPASSSSSSSQILSGDYETSCTEAWLFYRQPLGFLRPRGFSAM